MWKLSYIFVLSLYFNTYCVLKSQLIRERRRAYRDYGDDSRGLRSSAPNILLESANSTKVCHTTMNYEYVLIFDESRSIQRKNWDSVIIPALKKFVKYFKSQDGRVSFTLLGFGKSNKVYLTKQESEGKSLQEILDLVVGIKFPGQTATNTGNAIEEANNIHKSAEKEAEIRTILVTDGVPTQGQLPKAIENAKEISRKKNYQGYLLLVQNLATLNQYFRKSIKDLAASLTGCSSHDIDNNICQQYVASDFDDLGQNVENLLQTDCRVNKQQEKAAKENIKKAVVRKKKEDKKNTLLYIILGVFGAVIIISVPVAYIFYRRITRNKGKSITDHPFKDYEENQNIEEKQKEFFTIPKYEDFA